MKHEVGECVLCNDLGVSGSAVMFNVVILQAWIQAADNVQRSATNVNNTRAHDVQEAVHMQMSSNM